MNHDLRIEDTPNWLVAVMLAVAAAGIAIVAWYVCAHTNLPTRSWHWLIAAYHVSPTLFIVCCSAIIGVGMLISVLSWDNAGIYGGAFLGVLGIILLFTVASAEPTPNQASAAQSVMNSHVPANQAPHPRSAR